jgi:hypothetical protein
MNRGRLEKYSLWLFRDFVLERGIAIVLIGALWGFVMFEPARRSMGPQWTGDQTSPFWGIALQVSSAIVSLSVLIAVNGIVATDVRAATTASSSPTDQPSVVLRRRFLLSSIWSVFWQRCCVVDSLHALLPPSVVDFLPIPRLIFTSRWAALFFLSVATRFDWPVTRWCLARVAHPARAYEPAGRLAHKAWSSRFLRFIASTKWQTPGSGKELRSGPGRQWAAGLRLAFFILGLVVIRTDRRQTSERNCTTGITKYQANRPLNGLTVLIQEDHPPGRRHRDLRQGRLL